MLCDLSVPSTVCLPSCGLLLLSRLFRPGDRYGGGKNKSCGEQAIVCSVDCAVCSVECGVCSVQCTVFSVQCAVYSLKCALCKVKTARDADNFSSCMSSNLY